jgi:hypothetical protein
MACSVATLRVRRDVAFESVGMSRLQRSLVHHMSDKRQRRPWSGDGMPLRTSMPEPVRLCHVTLGWPRVASGCNEPLVLPSP